MTASVDIKDQLGTPRFSTPINEGSKRKFLLMKEDYITLKFSLDNPIYFQLGDYIDNELGMFELVDLYKPVYNASTGGYDYELRLDAYYWKWKNKVFKYLPESAGGEASWSLTATLETQLKVFERNLAALGYTYRGQAFEPRIDPSVEDKSLPMTYDNTNLLDALTQMAETWECEWWVEDNSIRFGRCEYSDPVTFELGVNVQEMARSDSRMPYATRVYAFGSTRNIPDTYRKSLVFDVKQVNGRDISDTARPLEIKFFPGRVVHKEEFDVALDLGTSLLHTNNRSWDHDELLSSRVSGGTYRAVDKGAGIAFRVGTFYSVSSPGSRPNLPAGDYLLGASYVYRSGGVEKEIPIGSRTVTLGENQQAEFSESFELPSEVVIDKDASDLVIRTSLLIPSYTLPGVSIAPNVKYDLSLMKGSSAQASVTFLSGSNEGRTFSVVYNPEMVIGEGSNVLRLPEGVTASPGDRYTIDNLIKGKVPSGYFSKDDHEVTLNGVVQKRLMLPPDVACVDAYRYSPSGERIDMEDVRYNNPENMEMPQEEAVEAVVVFEDEYPKYTGSTVEVPEPRMEDELDEENNPTGNKYPVYSFTDPGLKNFTEDFRLKDTELRLVFQTGKLAGLDFGLDLKGSDETGTTFEIIPNEDYGRRLPDDTLFPQAAHTENGKEVPADTYVLHGFDTAYISEQMLPDSEVSLLDKAREYVKKSMVDPSTYDCKMMSSWAYGTHPVSGASDAAYAKSLTVGDRVKLVNKAYFTEGRQSRVIGFEYNLDMPYDSPVYTVGETAAYSRLGEMEEKIDSLTYKGQTYSGTGSSGGGPGVYVIGVNDRTPASDRNVFSAKRTLNEIRQRALSRLEDDTASGHLDLEKGFTSRAACSIDGSLSVSQGARLSGGVVVVADVDYGVRESEKENPENINVMATGLTEIPGGGGFGPGSLGGMDNTDESFDSVPDGNYMMQKRAGVFYPVKAAVGGGGTRLTLTFVTPSNMTAVHGRETPVKYTYSSLLSGEETGEGIATYTLNGRQVASETVAQGEVSFNVGKYLALGENTLVVQVTDSYGSTRKLTFKISAVSISVTSAFDDSKVYNGPISFPYIPLGAVEKTIHFILDGRETGTYVTSASNRQQTYSIPAQSHGAHTLEVYATATINEVEVESDRIRYEIISIVPGNNTPIIASSFRATAVEQFGALLIPYIVYNPAATTSDITLWVNGTVVSEQTVDRTRQMWSYRAETPGALELKIACGAASKTFNLTVSESEINVEPELADLVLFLTSVNRSNNEEGRNVWNYGEIFALLTAFNWATNGWVKTIDGFVALRVNGDARVTIPYNSFANDFRAMGKTLEFEFETRDVTDYDAVVLSCMSGNIGLEITAQKAIFKSEQSTVETQFKEDERVRVSFVVEKKAENRLVFVYINGEICGVLQYPEQDNFTQPDPVGITIGNSECTADIFNIRVYDNALNRYQLLDNYIADTGNLELKRRLYARNDIYDDYGNVSYDKLAKENISFTVTGDLPTFKGDKKTVTLAYEDREHPERSWVADNVQIDVQGTSSQYYPRKNFKVKCKGGFTMTATGEHTDKVAVFEGEIPVNVFCFKADFAESSGVHNTGMARLVDYILRGMGFLTEPQKEDSRIRTTVNGRPCVMWHQESENGGKSFQGKYNFNNDKSTNETFGFTAGCESWEIRNNTSDRVLFKASDYITVDSEGNAEWLKDFEARYSDGNEDYTNLKRLTDWLVSVKDDPARFRAEADGYLDMDFMLSYYTITEFFAMVDQRAKNMFLTTFDGLRWICIFYDNDTCCGLNNEGASAFDYTVEYHDRIGSKDVWNGAGSTLWNNIERAYPTEIAAMYAEMRSRKLLAYEECIRFFDTAQGDCWCEAVYNEDSWFKYVKPLLDEGNGSYLYAAQGSRKMHRRWWLYNRFKYMDSKYIAGDYKNDFATLRLYTPAQWAGVAPNADMDITSYAGQYVNVKYGSYTVGSRTQRNVPVHIGAPDIRFNDTETIIYGAGQISSLGDLSSLYPGTVDVAKMTKLVELVVGSGVEGYRNTNLEVLSVGANNLLRKLDVRNCPRLKQAIDLSQCTNIREVWAEGTGTTAVVLPEGGNLALLHLPDTVTNLTVRNQSRLNDSGLSIAGVGNLSTIRWENTNGANVLLVIDRCFALDAPKLERVRIIGADWNLSTLDILTRLITLKGLDENGNNVDKAVVTGKCYISSVSEYQLNKVKAAFPELTITYGQLKPTPVTTFTFSSSQNRALTNSVFTCNVEFDKISDTQYKVAVEDGTLVELTYKADNHEELVQTYETAGTRTQNYRVTYIPVRTIRVKVYGQSRYVSGATVTIGGESYISDANGYVTLPRSGAAVSGSVSAYGYAGNTFSFGAITSDTTNTVEVYAAVDVKFVVKYDSSLVQGATVKSGSQTAVTNQYGECVLPLGKGTQDYTVTHPNYFDYSGQVTVGTSATTVNVTLEFNFETLKPVENGNIQMLLKGALVYVYITSTQAGYIIDWGDGEETTATETGRQTYIHTYSDDGLFQMEVKNHAGITSCISSSSCLVAYWSIGTSGVKDVTFYGCSKLKYFGDVFKNDVNRTNVKGLFYYCSELISIDLTPLASWVNVTDASRLFDHCSSLTSIDLTPLAGWVNVTNASQLLAYCRGLTSIDLTPLSGWTKVTDASYLFWESYGLTSIDLTPLASWVNVTNASRLFDHCSSLTSIDLTPLAGWVNVTNASRLFDHCSSLTSIDLTPLASWVNVTNASQLLAYCRGLTSIDLTPLSGWTKVTDASGMFHSCYGLISIELKPVSGWTNVVIASGLFAYCSELTSIDLDPLSGWTKVFNANGLFSNCSKLASLDLTPLSEWTKVNSNSSLISSCKNLTFILVLSATPFPLTSSALSNGNDCPIYVPDSAVDAYKTATNWSAYSSRIKPISEKP